MCMANVNNFPLPQTHASIEALCFSFFDEDTIRRAKSAAPKALALEDWMRMVKSEHVEAPTLKANLRAARDLALSKEQRQKAKLMLPYCTPHGLFKENRKDENLKRLSGIICLDFDRTNEDKQHIEMLHARGMEAEASAFTKDFISKVKAAAKEDPTAVFAAKSAGGLGAYVFLLVDEYEPAGIKRQIELASSRYASMGLNADAAATAISQARLLSHDPEPFIRKKAKRSPRTQPPNEPPAMLRGVQRSSGEIEQDKKFEAVKRIVEKAEQGGISMLDEYQTWVQAGFALKEFGHFGFELFDRLSRMSPKYKGQEDTRAQFERSKAGGGIGINTLFDIAKQYGVMAYDPTQKRGSKNGVHIPSGRMVVTKLGADPRMGGLWIADKPQEDASQEQEQFELKPPTAGEEQEHEPILRSGDIISIREHEISIPRGAKGEAFLGLLNTIPSNKEWEQKTSHMQFVIECANAIRQAAKERGVKFCKPADIDLLYIFTGKHYQQTSKDELANLIKAAALRLKIPNEKASYYRFRSEVYEQLRIDSFEDLPPALANSVHVNLNNTLLTITSRQGEMQNLISEGPHNPNILCTYVLPFDYNKDAKCPQWEAFLNKVLPDTKQQLIVQEYIGALFIPNGHGGLKVEKLLILFGTGANGKSVFAEVITALIGKENVSHTSLNDLTNKEYYRASIKDTVLNYCTELSPTGMNIGVLKQFISGEPLPARHPYGMPMTLHQYAKAIVNTNELPKSNETTHAYFRRLLLIGFEVTIEEDKQDKDLHTKIIQSELAGILNWALEGLGRIIKSRGKFTESIKMKADLHEYANSLNPVQEYIEASRYAPKPSQAGEEPMRMGIKEVFENFREFEFAAGRQPLGRNEMVSRFMALGFTKRKEPHAVCLHIYTAPQNQAQDE